jgi:hypothetical protein
MARTDPTIYMRLPEELKEALDKAAVENRRSLTAEVVARLEQTFVTQEKPASSEDATKDVAIRLAALEHELISRSRDETLLRLRYLQQGLATQEGLHRDRVERERDRLERIEIDADAAEDRGDHEAARRLRSKLREDRKYLKSMETDLQRVREELRAAEINLKSFEFGDPPAREEPAARPIRKRVRLQE